LLCCNVLVSTESLNRGEQTVSIPNNTYVYRSMKTSSPFVISVTPNTVRLFVKRGECPSGKDPEQLTEGSFNFEGSRPCSQTFTFSDFFSTSCSDSVVVDSLYFSLANFTSEDWCVAVKSSNQTANVQATIVWDHPYEIYILTGFSFLGLLFILWIASQWIPCYPVELLITVVSTLSLHYLFATYRGAHSEICFHFAPTFTAIGISILLLRRTDRSSVVTYWSIFIPIFYIVFTFTPEMGHQKELNNPFGKETLVVYLPKFVSLIFAAIVAGTVAILLKGQRTVMLWLQLTLVLLYLLLPAAKWLVSDHKNIIVLSPLIAAPLAMIVVVKYLPWSKRHVPLWLGGAFFSLGTWFWRKHIEIITFQDIKLFLKVVEPVDVLYFGLPLLGSLIVAAFIRRLVIYPLTIGAERRKAVFYADKISPAEWDTETKQYTEQQLYELKQTDAYKRWEKQKQQ